MKFTVLQRRWIECGKDQDPMVEMRPVMTLDAPTAEDAVRIAKQKGQLNPVVQPKKETS